MMSELTDKNDENLVELLLEYIGRRGNIDKRVFFRMVEETTLPAETRRDAMTVFEQCREEGIQQGMQQGKQEAVRAMAQLLLQKGYSDADVISVIKDIGMDADILTQIKG